MGQILSKETLSLNSEWIISEKEGSSPVEHPAPSVVRVMRSVGAWLIVALGIHALAFGELTTFQTTIGGAKKSAVLEQTILDGAPYVSLTHLIDQFGGASTTLPTRVQIDLMGITAWVRINEKAVNVSLSRFSLKHAIRREGGDVLIASEDVAVLFSRSFRLTIRQDSRGRRPSQARILDKRPVEIEDLNETGRTPSTLTNTFTLRPEQRRPIRRVIIDPGHGGYDTGAEGPSGSLEKNLTLAVARRLETFLERLVGVDAVLTRNGDTGLSNEERAQIGKEAQGDLFIALHTGASLSQSAIGFELFHPMAQGAATSFVRRRGEWLATPNSSFNAAVQSKEIAQWVEEAIATETASQSRGIHSSKLRLFEKVEMPSLLIEIGCLTNAREEALLGTEPYQTKMARAIANGIKR